MKPEEISVEEVFSVFGVNMEKLPEPVEIQVVRDELLLIFEGVLSVFDIRSAVLVTKCQRVTQRELNNTVYTYVLFSTPASKGVSPLRQFANYLWMYGVNAREVPPDFTSLSVCKIPQDSKIYPYSKAQEGDLMLSFVSGENDHRIIEWFKKNPRFRDGFVWRGRFPHVVIVMSEEPLREVEEEPQVERMQVYREESDEVARGE